jgi:hypothetical protein
VSRSEWWRDCGEIARLLRWLWEEDNIDQADMIAVVAKPWNWDAEYQDMLLDQTIPSESRENARLAWAEEELEIGS